MVGAGYKAEWHNVEQVGDTVRQMQLVEMNGLVLIKWWPIKGKVKTSITLGGTSKIAVRRVIIIIVYKGNITINQC